MILECPLPAALTPVPSQSCPFKLDQIVRLAFQRRQPQNTAPFATLADIQTLADWTAFKAAVDSTKIVMSPIFAGMVIPGSEGLFTGGNDNTTFNGLPDYNGEGSVTITGIMKNLAPAVKRALDKLSQESLANGVSATNLTVYMFNRSGYSFQINPLVGGEASTTYFGVPIYNFRLGSLGSEGFNSPNSHSFSFNVPGDWADYLTSVKPSFDPLVEI